MRSGRGKCPQCKEIIVVDLDAKEIRCPLCNALLKKSSKTVEEVRAEEEARIAAAQAREQALAEEAVAAAETAPVEEAPVVVSEPVEETSAEEVTVEETPAEAAAEEEAPADEIGLSDEELAAMDEAVPEEAVPEEVDVPAVEEAQEEAPVDEIGLSDEELAAMDEAIPVEDTAADDADELDIPASVAAEEVASEETDAPAESDEVAEENAEEFDDELPTDGAVTLDEPAEEPAVEIAEEAVAEEAVEEEAAIAEADIDIPAEEEPAEIADEVTAEEVPAEAVDEVPAEEEDIPVDAAEEAPVSEENEALTAEEIPVETAEEEIAIEEASAEESEEYVPTEEDMAFAASLSEGNNREKGKGFFAPVANAGKPAEKKEKPEKKAKKEKAPKAESANDNAIYKKPVALIITILSVLTAVFYFLYYKVLALRFISESLMTKLAEVLPTFGGDNFSLYVQTIFVGLLAVISILGLTGKRGRVAFIFVLLADLVYAAQTVLLGYVDIPKLVEILLTYGEYVSYGVYGLLLIGAIFFAVSIIRGSDDFEIHGATAIVPLVYLALVLVGYAALVVLPQMIAGFAVTTEIEHYVIYAIWGLAALLTLVGVHNAQASRGANAWLLFAATVIIVLLYGASVVLTKMDAGRNLEIYPDIFYAVSPVIALFPLAGFAASDMRN